MKHQNIRSLCLCAMFVAIICVCSWITVPFAVPFTLQTLAIFLTLLLLGGKLGTLTGLAYLFLGALGIPVFSSMQGGVGVLFGATGGYLFGFFFASLFYWCTEKIIKSAPLRLALSLLIIYAVGTLWFAILYLHRGEAISISSVFLACVLPFVIPDAIKLAFACFLSKKLKPICKI